MRTQFWQDFKEVDSTVDGLSNPDRIKNWEPAYADSQFLVGVSGFEPEASWTRTKRDTKLRHTPKAYTLYRKKVHMSTPKSTEKHLLLRKDTVKSRVIHNYMGQFSANADALAEIGVVK